MYKIVVTTSGPADKILVDGVPFSLMFINVSAMQEYVLSKPGILKVMFSTSDDSTSTVRTFIFDNKDNAIASGLMSSSNNPASLYTNRAGLEEYARLHSITTTAVLSEVTLSEIVGKVDPK